MSEKRLHDAETARTLTTETQTKRVGPAQCAEPGLPSAAESRRRFDAKRRCMAGTRRLLGNRETAQPNRGTARSMTAEVAVKSQGIRATPARTPISSRTGRRT